MLPLNLLTAGLQTLAALSVFNKTDTDITKSSNNIDSSSAVNNIISSDVTNDNLDLPQISFKPSQQIWENDLQGAGSIRTRDSRRLSKSDPGSFQGGVFAKDLPMQQQYPPPRPPIRLQQQQQQQLNVAVSPQPPSMFKQTSERRSLNDYWQSWFGQTDTDNTNNNIPPNKINNEPPSLLDSTSLNANMMTQYRSNLDSNLYGNHQVNQDKGNLPAMSRQRQLVERRRRRRRKQQQQYERTGYGMDYDLNPLQPNNQQRNQLKLTPDIPDFDYNEDDYFGSEDSIDRHYDGGGGYGSHGGYGVKKYKAGGHSNIYVYPGHHGGNSYSGMMDKFLVKMEGMLDKFSYHKPHHHYQPQKKDDGMGLTPLLLTLPLLLGLGALLFAATNGSNTVVNVNVNTTQTNTNGRSFDFGSPAYFSDDDYDFENPGNLPQDSDFFVVPKLMPGEATENVEFVEDEIVDYRTDFWTRAANLIWNYGSLRVEDVLNFLQMDPLLTESGRDAIPDFDNLPLPDEKNSGDPVLDAVKRRKAMEEDCQNEEEGCVTRSIRPVPD